MPLGETPLLTTEQVLDLIFKDPKVRHGLTEFADLVSPVHELLSIYPITSARGGSVETRYYLKCVKRNKDIQVWSPSKSCPEEIVRQLWLHRLLGRYGYPLDDIEVEYRVTFGTTTAAKPADIVVFESGSTTAKIVIECKKPKRADGLAQLKSYLNAEGSPVGVWSNGRDRILLYRPYPRDFDDTLTDIPRFGQTADEVLRERLTLEDLRVEFDFKGIIQDLEELVLANSGVDEFNEIFKIIYAKLYDEMCARDRRRGGELLFRKSADEAQTARAVGSLFDEAKAEWPGIFDENEDLKLTPQHLQVVVGPLERVRLLGANMRVMDDAFEYLMPNVAKKKNGQFFTPRYVIDMCVRMLQPKENEYVLDPACGSAGFLVHAMDHVWPANSEREREQRKSAYAGKYLWGVDFDERSAKVARALMLIAGDGQTRVFKTNSLDPREWFGSREGSDLRHALTDARLTEKAVPRSRELTESEAWEYFRQLRFDVILTNPPFAGEIRDVDLLGKYALAKRALKKQGGKEERDVLFIERCLDCLRPGGRMAIVLPQGKFNNLTLGFIRDYILERAQVLAVVGLHPNTFKPHTGTKTSVLLLRKFDEDDVETRREMRRSIEQTIPDFRGRLTSLAQEAEGGSISEADLDVDIIEMSAELFGIETVEDAGLERAACENADASEGEEENDTLLDEYLQAEASLAQARQSVAAAEGGAAAALRRAESALRRTLRTHAAAKYAHLSRSLAGRLTLMAEDDEVIEELESKYVLGEMAKQLDYEVFMAVSHVGGKTSSGQYVFRLKSDGTLATDEDGNPIIDQDCVSYTEAEAGIAEQYLAWAGDNQ